MYFITTPIGKPFALLGEFASRDEARAAAKSLGGVVRTEEEYAALRSSLEVVQATEEENAVHRSEIVYKSSIQKPCKEVWRIVDDMFKADPAMRRKDAIAACVAKGISLNTARTQYQQWYTASKASRAV